MKKTLDLETVIDIFDWYGSPTFELVNNILLTKLNGEERVRRAMPILRREARKLLNRYKNTEFAYPNYPIN